MKSLRLTNTRPKQKSRPKTVKQKYDRLKSINPEIDNLIQAFDLDIKL